MIKTIISLILLLIPFLLISRFKNKKLGFFCILSFFLAFHLIVAVLTQLFFVFSFSVVFIINVLVALIVLVKADYRELKRQIKRIKINKINWILVFVIIILFIQLFSVHYNYTGKVTAAVHSYKEVKNMQYPYPYFSDEWSAVALVKYSIDSRGLPLVNPLWVDAFFANFELPFHSFVSELILLLGLNPLTQYTILTIFTGLLICLLVYFVLRANGVDKLAAAIACLSVPYIVSGANLPGIWTLMPITLGMISLLLGMLFMSAGRKKMVLFTAFLTLVFYPPLFVLYTISLIFYFTFADISREEKIKSIFFYFILCGFVAIGIFIFVYAVVPSLGSAFDYLFVKIFYETFTKNSIPDFSIWKVIPVPILLFGIFGVVKVMKKKLWLVIPVFAGLAYWLLYSHVLWRFIIEYERIVIVASVLITVLAGFGLHYLINYLRKIKFIEKYKILTIVQILALILFFVFAFSYTQRSNWQELKLRSFNGNVYNPASPANIYLQEDDLKLFQGIEKKRFLSLPWKGLVIGVATGNYPLETKPATITNQIVKFSEFMDADCREKGGMAEEKEIDYVYSGEFDCKGFELVGESSEGLHLYQVSSFGEQV